MYITLKWKLRIEKIEDPAIWTKLVILKKLSVTHHNAWFLFKTF